MLSSFNNPGRSAERAAIDDEIGELEYVQSKLEAMLAKMEEDSRRGMTLCVAGWYDRISDLVGEIEREIDNLSRS